VKLRRLDEWNERRRSIGDRYAAGLAETSVQPVAHDPAAEPVWHLFVVQTDGRDALQRALATHGVGTLVHYEPLPHLTPAFRAEGWKEGMLPVAERLASRALSLPMFPQLSEQAVDQVLAAVDAVAVGVGHAQLRGG
jgi:dTDP-4-amino-4,6-dideoxygalactose transaminase